jgi:hypothetical protein
MITLRLTGVQTDESRCPAHAHEGKVRGIRHCIVPVRTHPGSKMGQTLFPRHGHICVVIAGYEGQPIGRAKTFHPLCSIGKFTPGCKIDDISCQRYMIWIGGENAVLNAIGDRQKMFGFAIEKPREAANETFTFEVAQYMSFTHMGKVNIREMGEREGHVSGFR